MSTTTPRPTARRKSPRVLFVMPATSLHGGNRIVFELADELLDRGYAVTVAGDAIASRDPTHVPLAIAAYFLRLHRARRCMGSA